jgi:hypothetical protein
MVVLTVLLLTIRCEKPEGIIQEDIVDVTSRITSCPEILGTGDTVVIEGAQLNDVVRVIFGNLTISRYELVYTPNGIKFQIPALAPNGENDVVLVFSGNERAFKKITVLPRQTYLFMDPIFGKAGDTITVWGTNLNVVENILIGDIEANIIEQPGNYLKFVIPANAYPNRVYLKTSLLSLPSKDTLIVCDNSDEFICLPNLMENGDFEMAPGYGVTTGDADLGPNWYAPGHNTRQILEIVPASSIPDPNYPGLGSKVLKAQINSEWLNSSAFTNNWQIQIVNSLTCDSNRVFRFMGKIWSDVAGRQVEVNGGVALPSYTNMLGTQELILNRGWNEFSIEIKHDRSLNQNERQIRAIISFGYLVNDGVTFYFDDLRVVDIGERHD